MMKTITAIIAITIKMPTPIPALKIPPTSSHEVSVSDASKSISILENLFCMIVFFGLFDG